MFESMTKTMEVAITKGFRVAGKWPHLMVANAEGELMPNVQAISISIEGGKPPVINVSFLASDAQIEMLIERLHEEKLASVEVSTSLYPRPPAPRPKRAKSYR